MKPTWKAVSDMAKLYEFRGMLDFAIVLAAPSRDAAEKEISTYESTWWECGEFLEVHDAELTDVRCAVSIEDEAHVDTFTEKRPEVRIAELEAENAKLRAALLEGGK